jgi:hypothetical protein
MTNPPKIKLEITGDPTTGNVQVAGPLQLKEICVKLLATAIQIVMDHDKKAPNPPNVLSPNGAPLPATKGN